jgi:hypothetical protein
LDQEASALLDFCQKGLSAKIKNYKDLPEKIIEGLKDKLGQKDLVVIDQKI